MFPIPRAPLAGNPHKRHYAETEAPASSKRSKAETQCVASLHAESDLLQLSGKKYFRLLDALPTVLTFQMMEWLDERSALQLIFTEKKQHANVKASYLVRLKPTMQQQPDPVPMSFPYKGDRSAQWTIVPGTYKTDVLGNRDGSEYITFDGAELQKHLAGPGDSSLDGYRPPWAARWKIRSIVQSTRGSGAGASVIYDGRLLNLGAEADHPVYLYRTPQNRRSHHLPNDEAGRKLLAKKGIYHPLSRRISNETGMTVARAEEVIKAQRQLIAAELGGERLSEQQRQALKNPLFAEHVECQRLSLTTALQLAENPKNLFYCLSLLPLLRSGIISLSTVATTSEQGIRLLHDPRLVKLLCRGLLSEQQVATLTQIQYRAILILYRPLLTRQLSAHDALALSAEQLAGLGKAELLEDLSRGRISLASALRRKSEPSASSNLKHAESMPPEDVARLMAVWPVAEMCKDLVGPDQQLDLDWIAAYQRVSQLVPALQKIDIPDFSQSSSSSSSSFSFSSSSPFSSSSSFASWSSSDTLLSLTPLPDGPLLSLSEVMRQTDQPASADGVPLRDVALLLSRMPAAIVHRVILDDGYGGNADWVTRFGKLLHLMPMKKITGFLETGARNNDLDDELFNTFADGLGKKESQAVAIAFSQIFIDLAEHLDAEEYLELAEMFLDNLSGLMVSWGFRMANPIMIDQCRQIWSLAQSKCEISGRPLDRCQELVRTIVLEAPPWGHGFEGYNGTDDEQTMASFASFIHTTGLAEQDEFLKKWTDKNFDDDFDLFYRNRCEYWGRSWGWVKGSGACHAILSTLPDAEYSATARRYMSMLIDKGPCPDADD